MVVDFLALVGGLETSINLVCWLASQIQKWKLFGQRIFDLEEMLDVALVDLEDWRCDYLHRQEPTWEFMKELFGPEGAGRILKTLQNIEDLEASIKSHVGEIIKRAVGSKERVTGPLDTKTLARDFIRDINEGTPATSKFKNSVWGKVDDLERKAESLNNKMGRLTRFADHYMRLAHPEVAEFGKRPPGCMTIVNFGDESAMVKHMRMLRDARSAQENARLLQVASTRNLKDGVHVGIYTPQLLETDYSIVFSSNGHASEIVARPAQIKSRNAHVTGDLSTAIASLYQYPDGPSCILSKSPQSEGFELYLLPENILPWQHTRTLSSCITQPGHQRNENSLHYHDQVGIAAGIAHGAFRLVGSKWLEYLNTTNVYWCKQSRNWKVAREHWTLMLGASANGFIRGSSLDRYVQETRGGVGHRDLTKHVHVFTIGLLLAEIALNHEISYLDCSQGEIKMYIQGFLDSDPTGGGMPEEWDALALSALIASRMCNHYLADMVLVCLSALTERDGKLMSELELEEVYCKQVLGRAERMEEALRVSDAGVSDSLLSGAQSLLQF